MNKLLIIGIGSVSLKYLARALARHGYQGLLLGRREGYSAQIAEHLADLEFHQVDSTSPTAIIDFIQNNRGLFVDVVAVTSLFDEMFPLIETLAERFNWMSPGPIVAALSDKDAVLQCVREFSPPSLCFTRDQLPALDPVAVRALGERLVVKPVLSSGGLGLKHLSAPTSVEALAAHLADSCFADDTKWLLQRELSGRLLSFEGYVDKGQLHPLGVSSRSRIGFTEVANKYPAQYALEPELVERGWACVRALVSRARYDYGYFHCEFIQCDASVYLVDANIGRIGGATLLEQIALAHDLDIEDLLAHVLLLPLLKHRLPPRLAQRINKARHATLGIWYGMPVSARLDQVSLPTLLGKHTQFSADGHTVPCVGESDYAWVGMLSGLEHDVLEDIEQITLHTAKGTFKPAYSLD